MTLTVQRIANHRDNSDANAPAFLNAPYYSSPNDRYVASWNSNVSQNDVCVADLQTLTVVQNYDIGSSTIPDDLLPYVSYFDLHAAGIDDDGSLWMAAGDGGGQIFEFPIGQLDAPVYRFTLAAGGGGDPYWFKIGQSFTLPDNSIQLVLVEKSETERVYDYHTWNKATSAYTHTTLTWQPLCAFQDDNGDLWVAGCDVSTDTISSAHFSRITDVTGSSPYPATQEITGLPEIAYPGGSHTPACLWGTVVDGAFVGGWFSGAPTMERPQYGQRCDHLIRVALDGSGTVVSRDITGDAPSGYYWAIPTVQIPVGVSSLSLQVYDPTEPLYTTNTDVRQFGFFDTTSLNLTQSYDLNDWNAADDLTSYVSDGTNPAPSYDAFGDQFLYNRRAFIAQSNGTGYYEPDNPDETLQKFGKLWIYGLGDGGAGAAVDLSQEPNLRVWGYSLDGHDFYVLRVGSSETLVYDLTTGQWSHWASPDRENWRAHVGQNWLGMSQATFANDFGSDVVCGDDATGILWILDPAAGQDDNTDTGSSSYTRMVIGGIPLQGRDVAPCNAVQLTASLGNVAMSGAGITVTLRTSDDFGNSYLNHGTLNVTTSHLQVLEWRALGQMKQPGRVFELSDTGITRISGLDAR